MRNIILISLVLALFTQCTKKTEISQWRGPNRDGIYPETNLLKEWPENGPELIWKYDELGNGYSSAAVLSDKVITIATIDSINYVIAFDHKGSVLYKKELGKEWMINFPGARSTPLIYGNMGYFLNGLGKLYCFNADNGEIIWLKDLFSDFDGENKKFGITENLLIDDDKLFCTPGGKEDNIIALNRHTGELIWKREGNGGASHYASPILVEIAEEKYIITIVGSSILSVNTTNGNLAWEYNVRAGNPLPIYKDGYLFIIDFITEENRGAIMLKIADDGKSVSKEWFSEYLNVNMMIGGEILMDNKIFGSNAKKKSIFCIDWNTGAPIDSLETNSFITTLIAAEGLLYSYTFGGDFSLLQHNENGFKTLGSFSVEGGIERQHCSQPVIHNGRLYIRHDNSLFVYNIAKT
ncbi:MAG: PQQ-binding-like beta-propeller repeat protein [Bacteroidales bacterium]|nr:PQQ-binding-like beta-propeller repeat protein [Bacteroidales bacterium]